MAKWTMKKLRAKTREILNDPGSGMDQKTLAIAIKLGQSSMSHFLSAPDDKIPSINGDALLCLASEVDTWERSRDDDMAREEVAAPYGGVITFEKFSGYDEMPERHWLRFGAALIGLSAIVRSTISVEEKQIATNEILGLYAKIKERLDSIGGVKQA